MSMSDKSIKEIINKLNNGNKEDIFLQKLSENIEYGIVWHKVEQFHPFKGRYYRERRDRFYFIKNEDEFYIGAVLIMDKLDDLHAYVLKEHRKQGHLFKAMTIVILPHLFQCRERVRITIDEDRLGEKKYENSKRSAESLGFKSTDGEEFFLSRSYIEPIDKVYVEMHYMTRERVKELQKKMEDLANALAKIDDEFKMTLGCIPNLGEFKQDMEDYSSYKLGIEYDRLIARTTSNN